MNALAWAAFPYVSLTLFFIVPFIRMRLRPYEITTRATSLFTRDVLGFASLMLHWGIFLLLVGHIAGLVGGVQGWGAWIGAFFWLALVGGLMAIVGSAIALIRRMTVPELRALSQSDDYIVHFFLIAIIGIGLYQAVVDQIWGVAYTAGAWFASLWRFQPEPELMASAPLLSQIHITLAFTFAAYFPFTKLVHMWTLPVNYFVRPYQAMRTQARKFQRRWEFGLRSDQSFLTYSAIAAVALFVGVTFLRGPVLQAMQDADRPAITRAEAASPPARPGVPEGYARYVSQCARCHGLDGRGDVFSRYSPKFAEPPRDFTQGHFRFVSTGNQVATDADLKHVIGHGLPKAGMPAFDRLTERQIDSLVEVLDVFWKDRPEPGARVEAGPVPDFDVRMIERGRKLYAVNCVACHGERGWGDGPAAVGLPVPPANLAAGEVKAGTDPVQLYYRTAVGIPGDEGVLMPGFGHLDREEIWSIVGYLRRDLLPATAGQD